MRVRELIEKLAMLPPDTPVVTNACEATYTHEDIVPLCDVEETKDGQVFLGTNAAHHVRGER